MLNYEINLQCNENTKKRRFSSSPVILAGLLMLSLLIVAVLYAAALLYAKHLKSAIAENEADVNGLIAETKPLEALEERYLTICMKADLEAKLRPAGQAVSEILQQVNGKHSENLNISSINVENCGIVYIVGTSNKMQSVAAYCQALEQLSSVNAVVITEIKLAGSGLYSFHVELHHGEVSVHEVGN